MTAPIFKPAVVIEGLGELGRLPDCAIINAGGTSGPTFTVGGRGLLFTDGTSSSGSGGTTIGNCTGLEYVQSSSSNVWVVVHGKNTKKIHLTIWDVTDEIVFPDTVQIIDLNTIHVTFSTAMAGRADLIVFP